MSARDFGDGEPDAGAAGRRSSSGTVREQSAEYTGRRGGGAGRGVRDPHFRDQGGGQRDVLRPHKVGARSEAEYHDGRRGGPGRRAALGADGAAAERSGRHGGDDYRGHTAHQPGGGRASEVPDNIGERRRHEALLRQQVRHRTEHVGRDHPRDQHTLGGEEGRCVRVRLVRTRLRASCAGDGSAHDRDGGECRSRAGGGDGRSPGDDDGRGR